MGPNYIIDEVKPLLKYQIGDGRQTGLKNQPLLLNKLMIIGSLWIKWILDKMAKERLVSKYKALSQAYYHLCTRILVSKCKVTLKVFWSNHFSHYEFFQFT